MTNLDEARNEQHRKRLIFIDASQSVREEKKEKGERERNGRQNTRTHIHKFILIFSRRMNLKHYCIIRYIDTRVDLFFR